LHFHNIKVNLSEQFLKLIAMAKKTKFYLLIILILIIVIFVVAEIALRVLGFSSSADKPKLNIVVEPGITYFKKDNILGYTHLPGVYKITLNGNYTFVTSHNDNTLRITHPTAEDSLFVDLPKIWMMGGSITHGWSINDSETFAWLVQDHFHNDYEIINFGVSGYGTIHSLLQILQALKTQEKPEKIIIFYASFHDMRNAFSARRKKAVTSMNFLGPLSQPYASLNDNNELQIHNIDTVVYEEFFFADKLAVVNFLENVYLYFDGKFSDDQEITKEILLKINEICKENNIEFIVAGIFPDQETLNMLEFCNSKNINMLDISVPKSKEYVNLPHDGHPSPLANKIYSEKIINYISNSKNNN